MAAERDWHPEDIKAAIRKTGVTLEALSVQFGYERSSVRKVFQRPSAKVQGLVARHLGLPPETIWPSRYDEHGIPLSRHKNDPSRKTGVRRRQTGVTA